MEGKSVPCRVMLLCGAFFGQAVLAFTVVDARARIATAELDRMQARRSTSDDSFSVSLKKQFMPFDLKSHFEAAHDRCDAYLSVHSCDWTKRYNCRGQPRTSNYVRDAVNDHSLGYECCCDLQQWRNLPQAADSCEDYLAKEGCAWTARYPCGDQFQSGEERDSESDGIAYKCCCSQGHWKQAQLHRIDHFSLLVKTSNQCEAYVRDSGCSWTLSYPCPDQPKTTKYVSDTTNDGSEAYQCCCELSLWKDVYEEFEAAVCDAHVVREGCAWTSAQPCPGQPRKENLRAAVDDGSEAFNCCCNRELWKKDAQCEAIAAAGRCAWTGRRSCSGQPKTNFHIADAVNDGSDIYRCCCSLEYWKEDRSWENSGLESSSAELMFVHIPLNAGDRFRNASEGGAFRFPRQWPAFQQELDMPDDSTCEKFLVPPQYLRALGEPAKHVSIFKKHETFCVTRSPFDRLVSLYKQLLAAEWGPYTSSQYHTNLLDEPACSRGGLNTFLQSALEKVDDGRKFLHGCQFLPQIEYIQGEDGVQWCQHVLRHDTLQDDLDSLMSTRNHGAELPKFIDERVEACGDISSADLDERTKMMIRKIYGKDFSQLHYQWDIY